MEAKTTERSSVQQSCPERYRLVQALGRDLDHLSYLQGIFSILLSYLRLCSVVQASNFHQPSPMGGGGHWWVMYMALSHFCSYKQCFPHIPLSNPNTFIGSPSWWYLYFVASSGVRNSYACLPRNSVSQPPPFETGSWLKLIS